MTIYNNVMYLSSNIANYINAIAILPESSFEILSSSTERISIMSFLAKNIVTLSQISETLGIAKSSAYRHLKKLHMYGWVRPIKDKFVKKVLYLPTALIYLCYNVNHNKLIISDENVCVIVPHCRTLLLRFRRKVIKFVRCPEECDRKMECIRELRKLAKKLEVDSQLDNADSIIEIYRIAAIRELSLQISTPLLTIPVDRTRLLYKEILTAI